MKKVTVALATYNPNENFLYKLLKSLNRQDYTNYDVVIMDDKSEKRDLIKRATQECLTTVKYKLLYNDENMGSNRTFERLTQIVDSNYIAYCDQDDIWEQDKISTLVRCFNTENVVAAYSDLRVIDENDNIVNVSFKNYMKHLKHYSGSELYKYFIKNNSITGCAMLIRTDIAKRALPFPDNKVYVHDHWLALCASCFGNISYIERPLINYRIHSDNQIGENILKDIKNKKDYLNIKLYFEKKRLDTIRKSALDILDSEVKSYDQFINVRIVYLKKPIINFFKMIKIIKQDPLRIIFEIILGFTPNYFSKFLIRLIKK